VPATPGVAGAAGEEAGAVRVTGGLDTDGDVAAGELADGEELPHAATSIAAVQASAAQAASRAQMINGGPFGEARQRL
jgi:hypothetical protein